MNACPCALLATVLAVGCAHAPPAPPPAPGSFEERVVREATDPSGPSVLGIHVGDDAGSLSQPPGFASCKPWPPPGDAVVICNAWHPDSKPGVLRVMTQRGAVIAVETRVAMPRAQSCEEFRSLSAQLAHALGPPKFSNDAYCSGSGPKPGAVLRASVVSWRFPKSRLVLDDEVPVDGTQPEVRVDLHMVVGAHGHE